MNTLIDPTLIDMETIVATSDDLSVPDRVAAQQLARFSRIIPTKC